jgi:hypothetical protein
MILTQSILFEKTQGSYDKIALTFVMFGRRMTFASDAIAYLEKESF